MLRTVRRSTSATVTSAASPQRPANGTTPGCALSPLCPAADQPGPCPPGSALAGTVSGPISIPFETKPTQSLFCRQTLNNVNLRSENHASFAEGECHPTRHRGSSEGLSRAGPQDAPQSALQRLHHPCQQKWGERESDCSTRVKKFTGNKSEKRKLPLSFMSQHLECKTGTSVRYRQRGNEGWTGDGRGRAKNKKKNKTTYGLTFLSGSGCCFLASSSRQPSQLVNINQHKNS